MDSQLANLSNLSLSSPHKLRYVVTNEQGSQYLEIESFIIKFQRFIKEEKFKEEHFTSFESLTVREKQILGLIINGSNNPDISSLLNISRLTVEQHRKNINRKLDIGNMADIFNYALAFNLMQP